MADTEPILQGSLSLSSWLQLAEIEGISGLLAFESASLGFADGRLVRAHKGDHSGADAVFELFVTEPGAGRLSESTVQPDGIDWDSTTATLYGFRMLDEWNRVFPMVLATTQDDPAEGLAEIWGVFDGERTVAEVVAEARVPRARLVEPLAQAVREGALKAAAPPDEARALAASTPVSPEEFWDLMDQAHDLMRSRDLAGAEQTLMRALRARPDDALARQNLLRVRRLAAKS